MVAAALLHLAAMKRFEELRLATTVGSSITGWLCLRFS
jgi:hypothetical protein